MYAQPPGLDSPFNQHYQNQVICTLLGVDKNVGETQWVRQHI